MHLLAKRIFAALHQSFGAKNWPQSEKKETTTFQKYKLTAKK
jgi:hypothetical protein